MKGIETKSLLNLKETILADLFKEDLYPWEILKHINKYILILGENLNENKYDKAYDDNKNPIWIHKDAKIAASVIMEGPIIIDEAANIKHCAYIRENTIIGKHCVVGNSSEIKNSILFNEAKAPHFNYVGDSILGHKAHLGAGVKLSNFKSDGSNISLLIDNKLVDTGLKKFGAILGDSVEIGCNSVTNPGTIVGRSTTIYPCLSVRGIIKPNIILKSTNPILSVLKNDK